MARVSICPPTPEKRINLVLYGYCLIFLQVKNPKRAVEKLFKCSQYPETSDSLLLFKEKVSFGSKEGINPNIRKRRGVIE